MAQRHWRQGAFFDAFARVLLGRALRFVGCLFALLQVVAPTWHVCEMGGRCRECKTAAFTFHSPKSATKAIGARCPLCKPQKVKAGLHGASVEADLRAEKFKGTCLARELMAMPGVTLAPLELIVRSVAQVTSPAAKFSLPECAASPLPPARAPPFAVL